MPLKLDTNRITLKLIKKHLKRGENGKIYIFKEYEQSAKLPPIPTQVSIEELRMHLINKYKWPASDKELADLISRLPIAPTNQHLVWFNNGFLDPETMRFTKITNRNSKILKKLEENPL
jgi:hypothetical protein